MKNKNPIRTQRMNELLEREEITQTMFAKMMNRSQPSISRTFANNSIDDTFLDDVLKLFPSYSRGWFDGKDDRPNSLEKLLKMDEDIQKEHKLLLNTVLSLASLDGFSVEPTKSDRQGIFSYLDSLNYSFIRDGKEEFIMSGGKMNSLCQFLYDSYISFMKYGSDIYTREKRRATYTPKSDYKQVNVNVGDIKSRYTKQKEIREEFENNSKNIMNDYER
jgi:hypothetical protein